MAASTRGFSRNISAATTATAFDPIDFLGVSGLERCQGFWVCNTDPTNATYLNTNGTASVNGDDMICLLPRQWTWVCKPDVNKTATPTAKTGWSLIAATAACNVNVVSDDGSWHPFR